MSAFEFESSPLTIRDDLAEAFAEVWRFIAGPGCWWTGPERVAIVAEARAATDCSLCRERKQALSPAMVAGPHRRVGSELPEVAVDAVHRIVTDATRLSKSWLDHFVDALGDAHYVELLGVTVLSISVDRFHRALGLPLPALPAPTAGEPSRYRPAGARLDGAWVPMLPARAATGAEADLYGGGGAPNVIRALSLVPDCVRFMRKLSSVMYVPIHQLTDLDADPGRAIDRAQIELIASRVSAVNECFY